MSNLTNTLGFKRPPIAWLIAWTLFLPPGLPGLLSSPQAASPHQAAAQRSTAPTDGGWPRAYKLASGDTTLSREQAQKVVSEFEKAMPTGDRLIALDRVLTSLDKSQIRPTAGDAVGIKADPPNIYHSTKPAVLMIFDGQPVWSPIKDVDLKYAVNTNWDVFEEPSSKTYYLRDDKSWLKATDLNGPWARTSSTAIGVLGTMAHSVYATIRIIAQAVWWPPDGRQLSRWRRIPGWWGQATLTSSSEWRRKLCR